MRGYACAWAQRTRPAAGGPSSAAGFDGGAGLLATLLVLAALVGLAAHDVEVAVELDVGLAAVVEGDLDLVVALLVADLGVGDRALAGVGQRCGPRPLQCGAIDWLLVLLAADGAVLASAAPPPPRAATEATTAMIFLLRVISILLSSSRTRVAIARPTMERANGMTVKRR